jgi:hypothetical protein
MLILARLFSLTVFSGTGNSVIDYWGSAISYLFRPLDPTLTKPDRSRFFLESSIEFVDYRRF